MCYKYGHFTCRINKICSLEFFQEVCIVKRNAPELPYNPAIPFLGINPREMKTHVHIKTCMNVHCSIIHNNQKKSKKNLNVHQLMNG